MTEGACLLKTDENNLRDKYGDANDERREDGKKSAEDGKNKACGQ